MDIGSSAWAAIGAMVQAVATLILIGVGAWQVQSIKMENKRSRTLSACDRYDTDPIIDESIREIVDLKLRKDTSSEKEWSAAKIQITTVLNYLDSIAVGIEQGLYIEELAKDHLKPIAIKHYDDYLKDESVAKKIGLVPEHFESLKRLTDQWRSSAVTYRGK